MRKAKKELVKSLRTLKQLVNKNSINQYVVLVLVNNYDNNEQINNKVIVVIVVVDNIFLSYV